MTRTQDTRPWPERDPVDCKGCGEPIRFVKWPVSGKTMPVDSQPSSQGDCMVDEEGNARKLGKNQEYTGPLYVSHFVTCEKRDEFRKSR